MRIRYEQIIPNVVGPKLAYHGFKYDETHSYPPQGHFFFSRHYWCKTQMISICPVEYDLEEAKAVISRKEEFPTEIPADLLLIKEPGFRMWLSNKYLTVILHNEHTGLSLVQHQGIIKNARSSIDSEPLVREADLERGRRLTWWEFQGEHELRRMLDAIVSIVVTQGLDWFEEQVKDIKRYHEKLDRRRQAAKTRAKISE